MAVALVDLGQRLERGDPLLLGLADADQDAAGERDPQLAGRLDRPQALAPGAWSASRRGPCPSAAPRSTRASAPARRSPRAAAPGPRGSGRRGSCAAGARARAPARRPRRRRRRSPSWPQDAQPRGDLRVDLGPLAGEHQQLLGVAPHRLVEPALDLIGRVEVRPVGRERAVLAVAAAGPRQRERVVAREGDAPHARKLQQREPRATCGAAAPPSRRRRRRSRPPRRPRSEAPGRARTAHPAITNR